MPFPRDSISVLVADGKRITDYTSFQSEEREIDMDLDFGGGVFVDFTGE